jgi:plastocyanin
MRELAYVLFLLIAMTPVGPAAARQADASAPIAGTIVDFEYHPPELTLTVGDSITWTNNGSRPHTVTDRGGLFDTDAILPGAQATVKLDVPGTYEFFCQINPSKMNARLVVAPAATPPTEVRVQAFDEGRTGETKRFDPPQLEVAAGTRVILANVGGLRHSLKAEDGSFAIPVVDPGDENGRFAGHNGSVVVNAVGTHAFFCEIHPAVMKGTLVVTAKKVVAKARPQAKAERPPPKATVSVAEFAFDKAETVVSAGGSVVWTNGGAKPHTATFDDVTLDTGTIEPGKSARLTAPGRPGTYSYHCSIHNQMRGVLVVSPQRALAAAPAVSTTPSGNTAGDVLAWTVAVLVVGVGIAGLLLGLRRSATT